MTRVFCFAPVADPAASLLILGSMPGKASLAAREYYAHPRNAFWPIMGELVGARPALPYDDRLKVLRASGIALWDVVASCIRTGSLDADIESGSVVPNDFSVFLAQHPGIVRICFNGAKAEQCFRKYVAPQLGSAMPDSQRLPSTSPAHAGLSYEEKLLAWQSALRRH